jgi:hypothetical protein
LWRHCQARLLTRKYGLARHHPIISVTAVPILFLDTRPAGFTSAAMTTTVTIGEI